DPETVIAYVWPTAAGEQPQIPVEDRPMLEVGDQGPDVRDMQSMIPDFSGEVDGDFGPITGQNVAAYQLSRGLEVDGIGGEETWGALYDNAEPLPSPPSTLTPEQQATIRNIAKTSRIADYSWEDRGVGPAGWVQGLALAFAQSYKKLNADDPAAMIM